MLYGLLGIASILLAVYFYGYTKGNSGVWRKIERKVERHTAEQMKKSDKARSRDKKILDRDDPNHSPQKRTKNLKKIYNR